MRIPLISDYINYFKTFLHYVGKRFFLLLLLSLLVALADAFGITLLLPLLKYSQVGEGTLEGKTQILFDFIDFIGIPLTLSGILIFIGVVFVFKGIIKLSEGIYKGYLTALLSKKLKINLFRAYSSVDYQYFVSQNTGHFINVLVSQTNKFIQSFVKLAQFSAFVITTLVYLAVAAYLNLQFTLMAIAGGSILLYFLKFISRYAKKYSIITSSEQSSLNKFLVQALHAMKYLKVTNRFNQINKDVSKSIKNIANYRFRMMGAQAFVEAIREPFTVFIMIVIILVQVLIIEKPILPILVILLLFYRAMRQLAGLQVIWQQLMNQVGGMEMTKEEFKNVQFNKEDLGKKPIQDFKNKIEFKNVTFSYGDYPVLYNINLTIPVNKTIAFVGESGAGKSTLIDLITLLLKPQKGKITIDNVPASQILKKSWREKIGFVPQDTVVFDDTAANNIHLWTGNYNKDNACRNKTQLMSKKAHCHEFICQMKNGYNTRIGERGVKVSGGQRQRLAIARELYKEPQLLLLDEATSSLDTESERYIQQSIDELKGKMTVIIIAHRLSTIKNADYIYLLHKGKIIEQGTYKHLISQEGSKFKAMIEMQNL